MALKPGSLTLDESDKVLVVGPIAPATNRAGVPGFCATNSVTAALATSAAALLSS